MKRTRKSRTASKRDEITEELPAPDAAPDLLDEIDSILEDLDEILEEAEAQNRQFCPTCDCGLPLAQCHMQLGAVAAVGDS